MRIAPLVALFFAAAALSGAVAQPAPEQKGAPPSGDFTLRQGGWTQTGITVAEGDTLAFTFRPGAEVQQWMAANGRTLTYSMQIGERVYQVTEGRMTALASGPLAVRVEFPIGPPSRWPDVGITVQNEPRRPPSTDLPGAPIGTGSAPVGTPDGSTGGYGALPPLDPAESPYSERPAKADSPPGDDWTWLILPVAGGLGAALLLALGIKLLRRPRATPASAVAPPAIVISPSLDPLEGGFRGGEIALACPETTLGTRLELGRFDYRGTGPTIEREERDGGA